MQKETVGEKDEEKTKKKNNQRRGRGEDNGGAGSRDKEGARQKTETGARLWVLDTDGKKYPLVRGVSLLAAWRIHARTKATISPCLCASCVHPSSLVLLSH